MSKHKTFTVLGMFSESVSSTSVSCPAASRQHYSSHAYYSTGGKEFFLHTTNPSPLTHGQDDFLYILRTEEQAKHTPRFKHHNFQWTYWECPPNSGIMGASVFALYPSPTPLDSGPASVIAECAILVQIWVSNLRCRLAILICLALRTDYKTNASVT